MTTTHTIKCGNCKGQHDNADDVRACYAAKGYYGTKPSSAQPATQKQIDFALRLDSERDVPVAGANEHEAKCIANLEDMQGGKFVSKKEASAVIEYLLALPKATPAQHPDSQAQGQATEGMHKVGDDIYKVQRAVHGSGHLYAKRLVPGEGYGAKATFEYAPGILKTLSAATQMTLEEAKAFGALYGTCCVCGRTLTNEESIANGIGPVCGAKGGWA